MTKVDEKKVTMVAAITTKSDVARQNIDTILSFFGSYLIDKATFYSLWVEHDPQVITPFVADGNAVCRSQVRSGWDEVRGFWDPIHDEMKGTFNWTVDEVIVGEDPDVIITKSGSEIDVQTSAFWGEKPLKYRGRYIQIFKFEAGKIKSFEEYYDTALLNASYT